MKRTVATACAVWLGWGVLSARADEVIWKAGAPQAAELGAPATLPMPRAAAQPIPVPPVEAPATLGPPVPGAMPGLLKVFGVEHKMPAPADVGMSPTINQMPPTSPELTLVNEYGLGTDAPGTPSKWFVRGEYLHWWVKDDIAPPLVLTGDPAVTNGALFSPGTVVLFGGDTYDQLRSGARFTAGCWLDECMTCGLDASVFFLDNAGFYSSFPSALYPLLTRPGFAVVPQGTSAPLGASAVEFVAFPGILAGAAVVDGQSSLWGAEVNAREVLCRDCAFRAEVSVGARYLELDEDLTITELISVLRTNPETRGQPTVPNPPGTLVTLFDRFRTNNQFYGGQIGGEVEWRWGRVLLGAGGKLALGVTRQTIDIYGQASLTEPGEATQVFLGGFYTAPASNIGVFTKNVFGVVPELMLKVGYQLTPRCHAFVGYNLLYWNDVVRPGGQIDLVIDPALIPLATPKPPPSGLLRPGVLFKQTDFWAQGLNFGVEARW